MDLVELSTLDIRDTASAFFPPDPKTQILDVCGVVPELDLFALLVWHLKRPQGPFTVLGPLDGDPDGPFKWDFGFQLADGTKLSFVRTWQTLEARALDRTVTADEVAAFVNHNLTLHADAVATTRAGLELHTLVLNPYVRHRRMADHAEQMLSQIAVPDIWYADGYSLTRAEGERHVESIKAHTSAAERETFYSVTLVTESAFAAEAFLNLVLAFTLRPEIRSNATIFEETLRRPWKTKIQYLPLTSVAVRETPNLGDARIRDADRVFKLRNRIAHSYPDPDDLAVGHVHFFKNFPVLEHGGPFDGFQLATQRLLPTRAEALASKKAAQGLVQYLSELIVEPVRDEVLLACNATPLGWRADRRSYSVPFGVSMVHALFFKEDPTGTETEQPAAVQASPAPDSYVAPETTPDEPGTA